MASSFEENHLSQLLSDRKRAEGMIHSVCFDVHNYYGSFGDTENPVYKTKLMLTKELDDLPRPVRLSVL